jgi:hypothetical protein
LVLVGALVVGVAVGVGRRLVRGVRMNMLHTARAVVLVQIHAFLVGCLNRFLWRAWLLDRRLAISSGLETKASSGR